MLETNGIPPKLNNQECEEPLCQQYCYRGMLVEVDILTGKKSLLDYLLKPVLSQRVG